MIIRPLLTTSRREVVEYLTYYALPHVEDSSNASDDFARNRIRHQVIPVLEDLFPGFLIRTGQSMALLRADEDCLAALARKLADQARPAEGGLSLEAAVLASAPAPVASRAVRLLLGELWGGDQDCARVHLDGILALCRGNSPSAQVQLPHGTLARRRYDQLDLIRGDGEIPPEPVILSPPGELAWGRWYIACSQEVYKGQPQGPWDFWLDWASVPALTLRPRQTGDRLALTGRPEKSLKKWMIQEKIPRHLRALLPVLTCGEQTAAVGGLGPDRAFCPSEGGAAWHLTISPAQPIGKE